MKNFITEVNTELGKGIEVDGVLYPQNESDLSRIIQLANQFLAPIVTFFNNNANGHKISLDKMDKILEICNDDFLGIFQGGARLESCKKSVVEKRLFFPFEGSWSSIGQAISHPQNIEMKYYVLGIRVVSPTGDILEFGGRTVKNVTGYNTTGFYYGSKEIFGIITQVTVKLTPLPKFDFAESVLFDEYPSVLYRLKNELDPNNILNNHILN